MKVGDKVYHKSLVGIATIVHKEIHQTYDPIKKFTKMRTKYIANYPNGESIIFYGYDINKIVFKSVPINQQTSLFDSIDN